MTPLKLLSIIALSALAGAAPAQAQPAAEPAARLSLSPCTIPVPAPDDGGSPRQEPARCGVFQVPENRSGGSSARMLPLRVVVLPAKTPPAREPVFFLSGGPGQAATEQADGFVDWWYRETHDVVLMDIRGTGEGHKLDCTLGGSDEDLRGYLDPLFAEGVGYAACRDALAERADLTQYTTPIAMQDLDELRQALGYDKILIEAGSYGTRAALTYIRKFGPNVRAAVLESAVPLENRAPLHHAAAAQRAFDGLVRQCQAEPACRRAYPTIAEDLRVVLARLEQAPARVRVSHPVSGEPVEISLSAKAFADSLRVMLYSVEESRKVPLLLRQARAGNLAPFARTAVESSRNFARAIRTGLLLAFTCSEDVWRIRPQEVARETAGSFIGDSRVRGQMEACSVWPRGEVPDSYYQPFTSDVPVLIISGELDPVTPPQWGEAMLRYFPNGTHVVLPGAHVPVDDCVNRMTRQLFDSGTVDGLDTSCVAEQRSPPFVLPDAAASGESAY